MREIVLDTETTGIEPADGHRLIEIGCVEVINHIPTGKTYHQYINPERDVPPDAVAVHGITDEFLADKPVFSQIYTDFLDFIGPDRLVIHNAVFDMKFINAELSMVGHAPLPMNRAFDTLRAARESFPARRRLLMHFAAGSRLTTRTACSTALCLMLKFWLRFIWSLWAAASRGWSWRQRAARRREPLPRKRQGMFRRRPLGGRGFSVKRGPMPRQKKKKRRMKPCSRK